MFVLYANAVFKMMANTNSAMKRSRGPAITLGGAECCKKECKDLPPQGLQDSVSEEG